MIDDEPLDIPEPSPLHYPGDHIPNQHPSGPHAPIPISHEPWERPEKLSILFFQVNRLKYNARDYYNDEEWPKLESELNNWLWILFDDYKKYGMQPRLWYDISIVRFHLHLHPLPRDMMMWHGPDHPTPPTLP